MAHQVAHHLLLAHARALEALRTIDDRLRVGIVLNQSGAEAGSEAAADVEAAERAWRQETYFLDPLLKGTYAGGGSPQGIRMEPGDLELISRPLDFLGINFYTRNVVAANGRLVHVPGSAYTAMGWEVCPPALRRLLGRMRSEYPLPPVYITENGAAFPDRVDPDGRIRDPERTDYLRRHIAQLRLAVDDGIDVRGYFAWSLLDNFEWTFGYAKRFGLVHVDHDTQERRIKDSGEWYRRFIGGEVPEHDPAAGGLGRAD
jgi:beta-glucosidase